MATTPCPRCSRELAERRSGRATLLACSECGGVWLDPKSARKVLEHRQGALTAIVLSERVAATATATATAVVDREKPIVCPFDAEPLTRTVAHGLEVDSCIVHGTWFDAGEVRRIANAFTSQSHVEAQPTSSPHGSTPPADYVSAFIGALFATMDELD